MHTYIHTSSELTRRLREYCHAALGTNNLDHPKKMPSDSQSSPAGLHEVAIGLAVVVGVCVLIGATLNVVGVVTAYWIVFSYKGNSANVGLWRICEQQTSGDIQCDYISDPPTAIGLDDYVYASRSLAVGAAVSCVVSVLIAVVGLIERKKALVVSAAAILFLQSIGFSQSGWRFSFGNSERISKHCPSM